MNFNHTHYVPCLRWKQGEYQAVLRLPDTIKNVFTPLIEIPELGWDFEEKKEKKTIDELLCGFALKKVYRKWGRSRCFVDLRLIPSAGRMEDGAHPISFIFNEFRAVRCLGVPVTGLLRDRGYQQQIKAVSEKDNRGICLRITIEEAAKNSFKREVDSLLSMLGIQTNDCDFVLDLGAPNFVPLEGFAKAIQAIVSSFPYLNDWRTFIVLGTSFPETMAIIKKGGEIIPRYEWQLYKILVNNFQKAGLRLPAFGDYGINHPKISEIDMRKAKPSASIRYAINGGWYIVKGENVKDKKYGKFKQYYKLSEQVLASGYYCGSNFSWGDNYIEKCANERAKTGNLSTWRQVGTNHHIVKVTQDVASFYASSSSP